jgi:trk system potassium uptake protein TrkA
VLRRLGASEIVHPEEDVARRLARRLARPDVIEEVPFLEGYVLAEVRAPKALWGLTLARSGLRAQHHLAVVAVKRKVDREDAALPAVPEQAVEEGDVLVVLARPADLDKFRRHHSL